MDDVILGKVGEFVDSGNEEVYDGVYGGIVVEIDKRIYM